MDNTVSLHFLMTCLLGIRSCPAADLTNMQMFLMITNLLNPSWGSMYKNIDHPGWPQLAASPARPPESQPSNCGGADRRPDPPHNLQDQLCLSPGFKVRENWVTKRDTIMEAGLLVSGSGGCSTRRREQVSRLTDQCRN